MKHGAILAAVGAVFLGCSGAPREEPGVSRLELTGWSAAGPLGTQRQGHTATLLWNGKVLLAGGGDSSGGNASATAELYDPATNTFTPTGSMTAPRRVHAATVLRSGKVLITGGLDQSSQHLRSAELYDPGTGTFTAVGSMANPRIAHTATLLSNGKVLIAGSVGFGGSVPTEGWLASAELFDPASATFAPTGTMSTARGFHTATPLPNGQVLMAGGYYLTGLGVLASAELYDPTSGTFLATGAMGTARGYHTATLLPSGKVLVAAGNGQLTFSSAELFDPATGTWTPTGSLSTARMFHSATLLANGKVLVAGGGAATAELYEPGTGTWSGAGALSFSRSSHTATLLPSGRLLVVGGTGLPAVSGSAELYEASSGGWTATGALATARSSHTATRLGSGRVLVVGGSASAQAGLASAELYDPAAGTFAATGSLAQPRSYHSATLLSSGKVLIAGGYSGAQLASAELYDPASGAFSATGPLAAARYLHTATLLPSGKVLIAGGWNTTTSTVLSSAELYDPASGTFSPTGTMGTPRYLATAVLLPSGKVLIAGGMSVASSSTVTRTAELYDPATGAFSPTGPMASARYDFTSTLLPSGKVLVVGGIGAGYLGSVELYDPATGTFSAAASLSASRFHHSAVGLPSGRVMIAGGGTTGAGGMPDFAPDTQLYDAVSGTWLSTSPLLTPRNNQAAVGLADGRVLMVGGSTNMGSIASAELFDELGGGGGWRPSLSGPAQAAAGSVVTVTGARFRGVSTASSGNRADSATNFPLVALQAPGGGAWTWLKVSAFTETSAEVAVPLLPAGRYRLRVVVNALATEASIDLSGDRPPVPNDQNGATLEDLAVNVVLSGNDPEGEALSFRVLTGPSRGALSGTPPQLLYTPELNFAGRDSFTFVVTAGGVDSVAGTVQIDVLPLNDAPTAVEMLLAGVPPAGVPFVLAGSDVDGEAVTYRVVSPPREGTLTGSPPALHYRPRAGFSGTDRLRFVVSDGALESEQAEVTFLVVPPPVDGGSAGGGSGADGGTSGGGGPASCRCASGGGSAGLAWSVGLLLAWCRGSTRRRVSTSRASPNPSDGPPDRQPQPSSTTTGVLSLAPPSVAAPPSEVAPPSIAAPPSDTPASSANPASTLIPPSPEPASEAPPSFSAPPSSPLRAT